MALSPGTLLGPYEIVAPSGAGGMGEVYRARDTRLGREVAIKVLPEHFSDDADLKARFDREARAISSLQHPNICVLYDVGRDEATGTDFLVMEYLEGETLAERLKKGPLPTEQLLKIGIEICDALEKAHRQGLVHRDLKPANVMLTKSGTKLLDFGLAKPMALVDAADASAPTFTAAPAGDSAISPLTARGTVVGTFQYMSPEQVEGGEADSRSDIFSFGALLYEMATGKRAFEGRSQLSVAAAILEKEPEPISTVQPLAPPALDYIVRNCLAKDSADRFQTAHDVGLQLRWVLEGGSRVGVPAVVGTRRKTHQRALWALASAGWLAAAAAIVLALGSMRSAEEATRLVRSELLPPQGVSYLPVSPGAMELSPDGTRLLFLGWEEGRARLWIRDLARGASTALDGTENAIYPFWSPDGRHVGFFADGRLRKVPSAGGPVQVLAEARAGRGGSWSTAGVIVFTPGILEPLYKIPEGGGTPQPVTPMDEEERGTRFSHRNPYFLPDGRRFLFTYRDSAEDEGRVYVGSVDGMEPQRVMERGSKVAYAGGHLLFMRDGNLVAQRFDPDKLRFDGDPIALAQDIDYWNPRDLGNFSAAGESALVFRTATTVTSQLGWAQPGSTAVETFGEPGRLGLLRVDPTGRRAAVSRSEPGGMEDVWLVDLERQVLSRLTFDSSMQVTFAFSPDGERIAIAQNGAVGHRITLRSATGVPGVETVADDTGDWVRVWDWTPDGRFLIIGQQRAETGNDIFYLDLEGERELVPLIVAPREQVSASISPNGRWLAYVSNESGRSEVYVVDFPAAGRKVQVTSGGGNNPLWSADGRELYFGSGGLKAVEVRDPTRMELGAVRDIVMPSDIRGGDFLPGEERALVLSRAAESDPPPVQLLVNWTKALQ